MLKVNHIPYAKFQDFILNGLEQGFLPTVYLLLYLFLHFSFSYTIFIHLLPILLPAFGGVE